MKKTDIVQPFAMSGAFAEGVYSTTGSEDFEIPMATSTAENDSCVLDDGFLPITSTSLEDGGIAPERKNFNGLFYLSTDLRCYLQNGGIITFNQEVANAIGGYPQDAVLDYLDSNGNYSKVLSLIDDNTNNFVSDPSVIDGTLWKKIDFRGGGERNIGEIVTSSLPLTDAGLHLLDGALLDGNGIYADFVRYIAELYTANSPANYFTTESDWQSSVSTYGVCGKFVYDSTANTVRLPKVSGILEGTTDLSALGTLVEAGLPNITGQLGNNYRGFITADWTYGAFAVNSTGAADWGGTGSATPYHSATFDASRSNAIYGKSSTVQPQTIKALVYIVVATTAKTEIQVDIDSVITDLNGKADTGLSNVNTTGQEVITNAMSPDTDTYIQVTNPAGAAFTAPYDCLWIYMSGLQGSALEQLYLNGKYIFIAQEYGSGMGRSTFSLYLQKGDVITGFTANDSNRNSGYVYMKLKRTTVGNN